MRESLWERENGGGRIGKGGWGREDPESPLSIPKTRTASVLSMFVFVLFQGKSKSFSAKHSEEKKNEQNTKTKKS